MGTKILNYLLNTNYFVLWLVWVAGLSVWNAFWNGNESNILISLFWYFVGYGLLIIFFWKLLSDFLRTHIKNASLQILLDTLESINKVTSHTKEKGIRVKANEEERKEKTKIIIEKINLLKTLGLKWSQIGKRAGHKNWNVIMQIKRWIYIPSVKTINKIEVVLDTLIQEKQWS